MSEQNSTNDLQHLTNGANGHHDADVPHSVPRTVPPHASATVLDSNVTTEPEVLNSPATDYTDTTSYSTYEDEAHSVPFEETPAPEDELATAETLTHDPVEEYYQAYAAPESSIATVDEETALDAETETASMVRAAAVDPDLGSDPSDSSELATLSGGDGGEPPHNGDYPTDYNPWVPPEPSLPARDKEQDLFEHLTELRARLLACVYAISGAMFVTWNFTTYFQQWLLAPVLGELKRYNIAANIQIIGPMDGFMIYFQISAICALLVAMPIVLYQLWRFVEPALTHHERRYSLILVPFSIGLFFTGVGLGYVMSPMFFRFFLQYTPPGVSPNFSYQDTIIILAKMLLVFGICFQVPVITIFVNKIGLVSRNWMIEYWRHVVVVIFTVVAIITPTWDPITLIICSLPPCFLYLLSIWIIKWL
ncbi:MAG: twin-arginine translocase subunit TatC [Abitibacteriaceae bacterium]|nr:twin-arginine translocase subunit TatC [Abditibacteriaceae bacterium]